MLQTVCMRENRSPRVQPGRARAAVMLGLFLVAPSLALGALGATPRPTAAAEQDPAAEAFDEILPEARSPLPGSRALRTEPCLAAESSSPEDWALVRTSRALLVKNGTAPKFDEHYCAIAARYEYDSDLGRRGVAGAGQARVTYKVSFPPYLGWWQHRFPVRVATDTRALVHDGAAVVDRGAVFSPAPVLPFPRSPLAPADLQRRMQALIGRPARPLQVLVGPLKGHVDDAQTLVRIYVSASAKNPNPTSCSDTEAVGTIDVETGEAAVSYTGVCE